MAVITCYKQERPAETLRGIVRLNVAISAAVHQKWAILPLHERNARFCEIYGLPTVGIGEVLAERKLQIRRYFEWLYNINQEL